MTSPRVQSQSQQAHGSVPFALLQTALSIGLNLWLFVRNAFLNTLAQTESIFLKSSEFDLLNRRVLMTRLKHGFALTGWRMTS